MSKNLISLDRFDERREEGLKTKATLPSSFDSTPKSVPESASKSEKEGPRIRVGPVVAVSIFTLTALAHFYLQRGFAPQAAADPKLDDLAKVARETASTSEPAAPAFSQEPGSTRARLDTTTRALILDCTKNLGVLSGAIERPFRNLREYLEVASLPPGEPPHQTQIKFRNLHLLDSEGHRLRLRIASKGESGEVETKLFGVDDESLPVPLPVPEELGSLGVFDAINAFKARGQVVLDETSEVLGWNNGVSASIFRQDGHVMSLRVSYRGGELACRSAAGDQDFVSCRCL